jgi:hypothetical protein
MLSPCRYFGPLQKTSLKFICGFGGIITGFTGMVFLSFSTAILIGKIHNYKKPTGELIISNDERLKNLRYNYWIQSATGLSISIPLLIMSIGLWKNIEFNGEKSCCSYIRYGMKHSACGFTVGSSILSILLGIKDFQQGLQIHDVINKKKD